MEEQEKQEVISGFWALFGKVSAVLTAAGTIIGLYLALNPSGPELEARGEFDNFALPPDLIQVIEGVKEGESWEVIEKELNRFWVDNEEIDEFERTKIAQHVGSFLGERWPEKFRYGVEPYRSFWHFAISNSGNLSADDVVLHVPFDGVSMITSRDETQEIRVIARVVDLGSLRPGDSVAVALWSEELGSAFDYSDVRLTHERGLGEVSFPRTIYGFRGVIASNLEFILFMAAVSVLLVATLVITSAWNLGLRVVIETSQERAQGP